MPLANTLLARLGAWIARRAGAVMIAWLVLVLASLPLAGDLANRLQRGGGTIPGSQASEVRRLLAEEFANPFADPKMVVLRSVKFTVHDPPFRDALAGMAAALRLRPEIARVASPTDAKADARLVSADGHAAFLLVGHSDGIKQAGASVAIVRAAVQSHLDALRAVDPELQSGTTGPSAFVADVIARNTADSRNAEMAIIGPALLLLLWVFASPVAAALPALLGVLATALTLASASVATSFIPLNTYVQSMATMIGLALGIDYALIMVSRYREERERGLEPDAAVAATLGTAGRTVACSGTVVALALGALIPSGLLELVSVGVGGLLVVAWSMALAMTFLPALLVLGDRWLDAPRKWSQPILERRTSRGRGRWSAWAQGVERWRWPAAALSLATLLVLAAPAGHFAFGLPDGRWYPADLESARGGDILLGMGQAGLSFPVQVVARTRGGNSVLAPRAVAAMVRFSRAMRREALVADVIGPVDLRPGQSAAAYVLLYADRERTLAKYPQITEFFLNREGTAAVIQVVLKGDAALSAAKAMVLRVRAQHAADPDLDFLIGGLAASELDLEASQWAYGPKVVAFVFLSTALWLFVAFRSIVIPLKAIALNLLAVGASMGCVALVFQDGYGHALVGLAAPLTSVPLTLPILVFCLTFGLSMDYEIFMLDRIREERRGPDGEIGAIARGLGATGGLVTAAAAIMILVFGAFVAVDMALVKMLGFGLAVAIFLDATLIRGVLAPAALAIAGRWNWWPGEKITP